MKNVPLPLVAAIFRLPVIFTIFSMTYSISVPRCFYRKMVSVITYETRLQGIMFVVLILVFPSLGNVLLNTITMCPCRCVSLMIGISISGVISGCRHHNNFLLSNIGEGEWERIATSKLLCVWFPECETKVIQTTDNANSIDSILFSII